MHSEAITPQMRMLRDSTRKKTHQEGKSYESLINEYAHEIKGISRYMRCDLLTSTRLLSQRLKEIDPAGIGMIPVYLIATYVELIEGGYKSDVICHQSS